MFWKKKSFAPPSLINIEKGSGVTSGKTGKSGEDATNQIKKIADMEDGMDKLCRLLSAPSSDFNSKTWLDELSVYIDKCDRLLYTNISNYIYELSSEQFTTFLTNLESAVSSKLSESDIPGEPSDNQRKHQNECRIILKFRDHVNLAHRQYVMFNTKNDEYERIVDTKLEKATVYKGLQAV